MTKINDNQIDITIKDTEPGVRRESLIKSIAAAIRWNSTCDCKKGDDDDRIYELSRLIEELTDLEEKVR